MRSPALILNSVCTRFVGYISHQTKYVGWPFVHSADDPSCSTVWFWNPSRPTQNTAHVSCLVHLTAGCFHDACTEVKVVPEAAYPDQLGEVVVPPATGARSVRIAGAPRAAVALIPPGAVAGAKPSATNATMPATMWRTASPSR